MRLLKQRLSDSQFVWALGSLCQLHRVPFDANLLLQQFAPPYDLASLITAAQALGFKTGQRQVKLDKLHKQALPCLTLLNASGAAANDRVAKAASHKAPRTEPVWSGEPAVRPDPSSVAEPTPAQHALTDESSKEANPPALALIVKADAERVLYFEAGSQTPTVASVSDFAQRYSGQVLLFKHENPANLPGDPEGQAKKTFGL